MVKMRPHPLPWFDRWRTNLIQTPLFVLTTALLGTLALLVSLVDKKGNLQHRIARFWARCSVVISGSRLTVRGAENLPRDAVAIYASNHTSYMDIPVIFSALPMQFRILAKKELWPIPFIGWYLNRSGQIPVDANGTAHSSLGAAVMALRSGMPLVIFPEGSRSADGRLQPFLSGAAYLAIRTQLPLVPMALSGVYELLPMHTHHYYPGELTLHIGQPIETKGMNLRQTAELTSLLRTVIDGLREPREAENLR